MLLSPCHHLASDTEVHAANRPQSRLYPQDGINSFYFHALNTIFTGTYHSSNYKALTMHRRQFGKHTFRAPPKLTQPCIEYDDDRQASIMSDERFVVSHIRKAAVAIASCISRKLAF